MLDSQPADMGHRCRKATRLEHEESGPSALQSGSRKQNAVSFVGSQDPSPWESVTLKVPLPFSANSV